MHRASPPCSRARDRDCRGLHAARSGGIPERIRRIATLHPSGCPARGEWTRWPEEEQPVLPTTSSAIGNSRRAHRDRLHPLGQRGPSLQLLRQGELPLPRGSATSARAVLPVTAKVRGKMSGTRLMSHSLGYASSSCCWFSQASTNSVLSQRRRPTSSSSRHQGFK